MVTIDTQNAQDTISRGLNSGLEQAKGLFNALNKNNQSRADIIYAAVVECGGSAAFLATGKLIEKCNVHYFVGGFISTNLQRICFIAALAFALDAIRRSAPALKDYDKFQGKVPSLLKPLMPKPLIPSNRETQKQAIRKEIQELADETKAKDFAKKTFDIDLCDGHKLEDLKKLLEEAATAKAKYENVELNYDLINTSKSISDEVAKMKNLYYMELLNIKVAYANALMLLSVKGAKAFIFANPFEGINEDILPHANLANQKYITVNKKDYTAKNIEQIDLKKTEWQDFIAELGK